MKKFLVISTLCLSLASCNRDPQRPVVDSNTYPNTHNHTDCNETKADWKITTSVKKQIMGDSSLSASARMVSVTTNNGVVTLSGTVLDRDERNKIVAMVKKISGVRSVNDLMDISNNY